MRTVRTLYFTRVLHLYPLPRVAYGRSRVDGRVGTNIDWDEGTFFETTDVFVQWLERKVSKNSGLNYV